MQDNGNARIPNDYNPAPPDAPNFQAPAHSHLSGSQREEIVALAESSHRDTSGGSSFGSEEYTRGDTTSGRSGHGLSQQVYGQSQQGYGQSQQGYSSSQQQQQSGYSSSQGYEDDRSIGTKIKDAVTPGSQTSTGQTGSRSGDYESTTGQTGSRSGDFGTTTARGNDASGIGRGTYESAGLGAGAAGLGAASGLGHHGSSTTGSSAVGTGSGLTGDSSASSYGTSSSANYGSSTGANIGSTGPGISSGSVGQYETSGTSRGAGLTGSTGAGDYSSSSNRGVGTAAAGAGALGAGAAGYGASSHGGQGLSSTGTTTGGRGEQLREAVSGHSSGSTGNKLQDELARNAKKSGTSARGFGTHGQGI